MSLGLAFSLTAAALVFALLGIVVEYDRKTKLEHGPESRDIFFSENWLIAFFALMRWGGFFILAVLSIWVFYMLM